MPGSGLRSPPRGRVAADRRRPGSENWRSALSPGARLCPLVLCLLALSCVPWSSALSLALYSIPWHSPLSLCSLLGLLGKSGVSWDRHPRRARAFRDSPVNSMPHQIAKQQQQLIQQQHKINLLQQQIQVLMGGAQAEGGTGLGESRGKGGCGTIPPPCPGLDEEAMPLLQFPPILLCCLQRVTQDVSPWSLLRFKDQEMGSQM